MGDPSSGERNRHWGTVMDEEFVISSGRDYEPKGEGANCSDGGASLVGEMLGCYGSSEEEGSKVEVRV